MKLMKIMTLTVYTLLIFLPFSMIMFQYVPFFSVPFVFCSPPAAFKNWLMGLVSCISCTLSGLALTLVAGAVELARHATWSM